MSEQGRDKQNAIVTIPNLLSAFRLLLVPVIAWLYCGRENYPMTALVLLLSGATDIVDGFIARRFDMVSDLGKVLDPVADKLTQTALLACLLTRFEALWALLAVLVVKEAVMAAMGLFVIRRTREVYSARWHGKLATCVIYTTIFLHIIWYEIPEEVSAVLAWCAIGTILLSLALYTVQNLRKVKR